MLFRDRYLDCQSSAETGRTAGWSREVPPLSVGRTLRIRAPRSVQTHSVCPYLGSRARRSK